MSNIETTGREALDEMRRLLGVLRRDDDESLARAPQPSVKHLDALVHQVTDAGLPVVLEIEGEPRPLAAGLDLSAYRIVQEALTNTLKHAGPASATVRLCYGDRDLELRVTDDGRGGAADRGRCRRRARAHRHARAGRPVRRRAGGRSEGRRWLRGAGDAPAPDRARMIRVLLVDDQPLLRKGFRMVLESEPDLEVAGEAADGVEAIAEAARTRPDVVLMDIRMPNLDGVEATRRIAPESKVLILTTFDLDEYVYEALRAGASGFLLKDVPPEDLIAAIRVIAAGDAVVAPNITRRLLDRFASSLPTNESPSRLPALDALTERELEVLTLMGRGLSNGEIATELHLGETTVKTHVGRVLMKLQLRDRVQAVVLADETGLVRPGT